MTRLHSKYLCITAMPQLRYLKKHTFLSIDMQVKNVQLCLKWFRENQSVARNSKAHLLRIINKWKCFLILTQRLLFVNFLVEWRCITHLRSRESDDADGAADWRQALVDLGRCQSGWWKGQLFMPAKPTPRCFLFSFSPRRLISLTRSVVEEPRNCISRAFLYCNVNNG